MAGALGESPSAKDYLTQIALMLQNLAFVFHQRLLRYRGRIDFISRRGAAGNHPQLSFANS